MGLNTCIVLHWVKERVCSLSLFSLCFHLSALPVHKVSHTCAKCSPLTPPFSHWCPFTSLPPSVNTTWWRRVSSSHTSSVSVCGGLDCSCLSLWSDWAGLFFGQNIKEKGSVCLPSQTWLGFMREPHMQTHSQKTHWPSHMHLATCSVSKDCVDWDVLFKENVCSLPWTSWRHWVAS